MKKIWDGNVVAAVREREIPDQSLLVKILTLKLECLVIGRQELNNKNTWTLLILSTLVMSLGTWLLVLGTHSISEVMNIPILFVAVVLSAAASSIPDTIISIKDARKGNFDDAISNALGSNIFDISFALGLPLLLYTLIYGQITMETGIREMSVELWMLLLIITVLGGIIYNFGKQLNKPKAYLFILIYGIFAFYVFGQAFGMDLTERISELLLSFVDWLEALI